MSIRKLARVMIGFGSAIVGFGLGTSAVEGETQLPADRPQITVQELKQLPKQSVKIDGRTFRQVVALQDGGDYTQAELEKAHAAIERGCSVYEDAKERCDVGGYENAVGESLAEYEARVIAPRYGDGQGVNDPTEVPA